LDDNEQAYQKNRRIEIKLTTRWKKIEIQIS
jgi:flagellar motor protein MotB